MFCGAVPAAELALEVAALRERELHASVRDLSARDDHAQVVQRRVWPEQALEERRREVRVDPRAALRDTAEADFSLDGDERADFPA